MLVIGITYFALIFISSATSNKKCEVVKFTRKSNIAIKCCFMNLKRGENLRINHGREYSFIKPNSIGFVCTIVNGRKYNTKNTHRPNYKSHDKGDDIPRITNYNFGDGDKRMNCPKGEVRSFNGTCVRAFEKGHLGIP
ncbi:hypothetical protein WA026_009330 [Henosepilachna vigintioctopunctata]|uniref:Uncharacterized protein n=1 Tax=Henosepilachna vigintioctopunctata TaxID=420089 RepID=A0AAW1UX67_9CUCU